MRKAIDLIKEMSIDPPRYLQEAILARIASLNKKEIRKQLFMSYAGFLMSIASFGLVFYIFGQALFRSEFWSIFSLAFSDLSIVSSNWQDFLFSALETLPSLAVASILIPLFILLLSATKYFSILNFINKHNYKKRNHLYA